MNIELFCCSGGMAAGFRSAGITFDLAIDASKDACDSYEKNLGHRPLQMTAEDFLRVVQLGMWSERVDFLCADPPCTPWSRAGKRQGLDDERDALGVTIDIIRRLLPRAFLIGNVPGLDDGCNLDSVHATIGSLTKHGYCVADYARLDAANYAVPQHRVRPFWFGHIRGTACLSWPTPTHGDPTKLGHPALGETRKPWVTCREALATLPQELWGRPVRLVRKARKDQSHRDASGRPTHQIDGTAHTLTKVSEQHALVLSEKHTATDVDEPSQTLGAKPRGNGASIIVSEKHPPSEMDAPATTVTADGLPSKPLVIRANHPTADEDAPARTITASTSTAGSDVLVLRDRDDGSVREMSIDEPASTVRAGRSSGERMITDMFPPSQEDEPSKTIRAAPRGTQVMEMPELKMGETHRPADLDDPAFTIGTSPTRTGGAGAIVEAPVDWRGNVRRRPFKQTSALELQATRTRTGSRRTAAELGLRFRGWMSDRRLSSWLATQRRADLGTVRSTRGQRLSCSAKPLRLVCKRSLTAGCSADSRSERAGACSVRPCRLRLRTRSRDRSRSGWRLTHEDDTGNVRGSSRRLRYRHARSALRLGTVRRRVKRRHRRSGRRRRRWCSQAHRQQFRRRRRRWLGRRRAATG